MKTILGAITGLIMVFAATAAMADLYIWVDENGKKHFVNDIDDVPSKYKDKVEVRESAPPSSTPSPSYAPPVEQPETYKEEFYDGHNALWWRTEYGVLRKKIGDKVEELRGKKQFVDLFERGRRLGQIYDEKDVNAYNKYKEELPMIEEELKRLESDVEDFRRKGRYYGVPKEAFGE